MTQPSVDVDPVEVLLSFRDDPAFAAAAAKTLLSEEALSGRLVSTGPIVGALASIYWMHRETPTAEILAQVAVSFDDEGARTFMREVDRYATNGSMAGHWRLGASFKPALRRLRRVNGTQAALSAFAHAELQVLRDRFRDSRDTSPGSMPGPLRASCLKMSDQYGVLVSYVDDTDLLLALAGEGGRTATQARRRLLKGNNPELTYALLAHPGVSLSLPRWVWAARRLPVSWRVELHKCNPPRRRRVSWSRGGAPWKA